MTIADQINRLNNAKAAIKQSIENKGVSVSDSDLLDEYPALIDRIPTGEGGGSVNDELFYNALTSNGTNYKYLFAYKTINDPSFIESLDTSKVTNMEETFGNFYSSKLDLSEWNVSKVTNMEDMFYYSNITELNLTGWDISNITSLATIFKNSRIATLIGVENWNTNKITNMKETFSECALTSLNISNWDVSNVTDMERTFYSTKLEVLDLSGWNTSNVKSFSGVYSCFQGGYAADTQKLKEVIGEIDLSSCTSGMVYNSSYWCFSKLPNLETLYLKNIYKNVTMKNELKWSINLKDTKVKDECLIYIINELPDLINDKGLTSTTNIKLTLPPTNTLTQEQVQVAIDKGWNVVNTTY